MTPEMMVAVKELSSYEAKPRWWNSTPVLRFHDYIVPVWWPICACIIGIYGAIANLYWAATDAKPGALKYAAIFAAIAGVSYVVTRLRRYSVIAEAGKLTCRSIGRRYAHLRTGELPSLSIQSVKERIGDQVLELRSDAGIILEIPMQVEGYDALHRYLRNVSGIRHRP
jgi:hypothetical protein